MIHRKTASDQGEKNILGMGWKWGKVAGHNVLLQTDQSNGIPNHLRITPTFPDLFICETNHHDLKRLYNYPNPAHVHTYMCKCFLCSNNKYPIIRNGQCAALSTKSDYTECPV